MILILRDIFAKLINGSATQNSTLSSRPFRPVLTLQKTPIVVGDTNPSTLATNFHFLYHPLSQIKLETRVQAGGLRARSDLGEVEGSAEYLGKSSTISLALYNPKCETGRMTIGFLHSFNNNFCAGAELLSEWMRNQVQYKLAIAARYVFSPYVHVCVCVFAFVYSVCLKREKHCEFCISRCTMNFSIEARAGRSFTCAREHCCGKFPHSVLLQCACFQIDLNSPLGRSAI
jgi:hypothetical protein